MGRDARVAPARGRAGRGCRASLLPHGPAAQFRRLVAHVLFAPLPNGEAESHNTDHDPSNAMLLVLTCAVLEIRLSRGVPRARIRRPGAA